MGRAPPGRVRDGLRLSSRFQLPAGRREAQTRDGSLGYASNKDAARVIQARRYTIVIVHNYAHPRRADVTSASVGARRQNVRRGPPKSARSFVLGAGFRPERSTEARTVPGKRWVPEGS